MNHFSVKEFAQLFVRLRNGIETAVGLGVPPESAKKASAKLLSSERVRKEISKLDKDDRQTLAYVKTGLSRLAFGQVNDVAALVFSEQPTPSQIAQADLFNVSELKKIKGGGVEVKFFDRQKALEKLFELDPELREQSKAEQFIESLRQSSQDNITHILDDDGGEESDI